MRERAARLRESCVLLSRARRPNAREYVGSARARTDERCDRCFFLLPRRRIDRSATPLPREYLHLVRVDVAARAYARRARAVLSLSLSLSLADRTRAPADLEVHALEPPVDLLEAGGRVGVDACARGGFGSVRSFLERDAGAALGSMVSRITLTVSFAASSVIVSCCCARTRNEALSEVSLRSSRRDLSGTITPP